MTETPSPVTVVLSPHEPRHRGFAAGMAIVFIGFFVFLFGTAIAAITWIVHPVIVALVGMMLLMAGGVVAAMAGEDRDRPTALPPPPSIGARRPPETREHVVLECPNCSAPPTDIDRFGVAMCAYCKTRFLVR